MVGKLHSKVKMLTKSLRNEQGEGGNNSGGNFKNDPDRASGAGKIGGSRSL